MTLMEIAQMLGSFGEFFGSIAVVATLGYLAVQIRQNTRSMDETRRLAVAQGYQVRSQAATAFLRHKADSDHIVQTLLRAKTEGQEALSALDQERLTAWHVAYVLEADNLHFQYEQGFVEKDFYEEEIRRQVIPYATSWESMGLYKGLRSGFLREIDRLQQKPVI